jgi:hypothetical protein
MPAFFAYLIALCLLLGGGYGALNWLAAPELANVAAKARPKAKLPSYEASSVQISKVNPSVASSAEGTSSPADDGNVPSSIARAALHEAETSAGVDRAVQSEIAQPRPDQQSRSSNAKVYSEEAKRTGPKAVRAGKAASPRALAAFASSTPGNVARTLKLPRQASNRSEKRTLALMTLRTIQFPDGRRVTQLIPYRERAFAFESDE